MWNSFYSPKEEKAEEKVNFVSQVKEASFLARGLSPLEWILTNRFNGYGRNFSCSSCWV